jgi:hypothetical protein
MEAYDLSHKLAYAGRRSPVPFTTGPEFTNSVPAVPVLSMLRIFLQPDQWSEENVMTVAREVARALGPTEQFDVGITVARNRYDPNIPAAGVTARLMKLDRNDPRLTLRIQEGLGDRVYTARFPRLQFEPSGDEDFWRAHFAPGAVKAASQE